MSRSLRIRALQPTVQNSVHLCYICHGDLKRTMTGDPIDTGVRRPQGRKR